MPPHSQGCPRIPQTNTIPFRITQLTRHRSFLLYSPVIHALLDAGEEEWSVLRDIRQRPLSPLFQVFFPNIYSTPPDDIFSLILQIRADTRWLALKQTVLVRVHHARASSLQRSGHSSTRPQEEPSQLPPNSQQSHPRFISQHPGRGTGPSRTARSPTSAEGRSPTGNPGRTAPRGYRFYCRSRNCKKSYQKQGHYENHMAQMHAEIAPHDPAESLHEIPSSGQPSVEDMSDLDAVGPQSSVTTLTAPRPTITISMAPPSIPPSPRRPIVPPPALNPHTVGSDTIQSGTSPQTSNPQERPPDTDMFPSGVDYIFDSDWRFIFPLGDQQSLEPPLSPTHSYPNPAFFPADSHMES
ncbi:hypothetical protein AYL99_11368 [Fonsecaea erecta]|uniref:C2H2-type domain-containing protein n=1 Tax=Fonsecaea erecta TaxID=1367422 RepID=A0A178Z3G0_9EURO|nr:hypothetical protein AYL99_11368 [Fonsecaea erecta]OAP54267.1 hypothetical protein AYL99_11368 [Fonsecaea erecta]